MDDAPTSAPVVVSTDAAAPTEFDPRVPVDGWVVEAKQPVEEADFGPKLPQKMDKDPKKHKYVLLC